MYSIVMLTAMSAGADAPPPMVPPAAPGGVTVAPPGYYPPGGYYAPGGAYPPGLGSCTGAGFGSYHAGKGGFVGHKSGGFLGHKGACHGSGYSCAGYNCFGSAWGGTGTGYGSGAWGTGGGGGFRPAYGSPSPHYPGTWRGGNGSWHTTGYTFGLPIGVYPPQASFPFNYSWAGTCHGGALTIYGPTWGPPVGLPPTALPGFTAGAPLWGSGPPIVFSTLTEWQSSYNPYFPNRPPEMTIPVAPEPKKAGSDAPPPMGANLKFKLPSDAKLYVDGRPIPGSGAERAFYTPKLEPGRKFFYEVKAELTVNGETVVEQKRVVVEAGANLTEEFSKLAAARAKADPIAGK